MFIKLNTMGRFHVQFALVMNVMCFCHVLMFYMIYVSENGLKRILHAPFAEGNSKILILKQLKNDAFTYLLFIIFFKGMKIFFIEKLSLDS